MTKTTIGFSPLIVVLLIIVLGIALSWRVNSYVLSSASGKPFDYAGNVLRCSQCRGVVWNTTGYIYECPDRGYKCIIKKEPDTWAYTETPIE